MLTQVTSLVVTCVLININTVCVGNSVCMFFVCIHCLYIRALFQKVGLVKTLSLLTLHEMRETLGFLFQKER